MEVSKARRHKVPEDENRRLKQLLAEKELDIQGLRAVRFSEGSESEDIPIKGSDKRIKKY